jgi:hypothetical protein
LPLFLVLQSELFAILLIPDAPPVIRATLSLYFVMLFIGVYNLLARLINVQATFYNKKSSYKYKLKTHKHET